MTLMSSGMTELIIPLMDSIMISLIPGRYLRINQAKMITISMTAQVEMTVSVIGMPRILKITCGVTASIAYPLEWLIIDCLNFSQPCHFSKNNNLNSECVKKTVNIADNEYDSETYNTVKIKTHRKKVPPTIRLILLRAFCGLINLTDHCWVSK
jgi:hypothetical protein